MIKLLDIVDELLVEGAYRPEQLSKAFDKWAQSKIKKFPGSNPEEIIRFYTTRYKDKFIKLYPFMPNTDIFNMTHEDLNSQLNQAEKTKEKHDIKTAKPNIDYKEIYADSKVKIIVPLTHKGSCKIGYGTKWCTAMSGSPQYFDQYTKDGILFRIIYLNSDHKISMWYRFEKEPIYFNEQDYQVDRPELSINAWDAIEKYYHENYQFPDTKKTK